MAHVDPNSPEGLAKRIARAEAELRTEHDPAERRSLAIRIEKMKKSATPPPKTHANFWRAP